MAEDIGIWLIHISYNMYVRGGIAMWALDLPLETLSTLKKAFLA